MLNKKNVRLSFGLCRIQSGTSSSQIEIPQAVDQAVGIERGLKCRVKHRDAF